MEIKTTRNGNELTVELEGRLDTLTSPDLEKKGLTKNLTALKR